MDGELVGGDVLALAALGDEHLGQGGGLLAGQQPADDVAAEDVEQHVEVASPTRPRVCAERTRTRLASVMGVSG
jgi:hypothetical protein